MALSNTQILECNRANSIDFAQGSPEYATWTNFFPSTEVFPGDSVRLLSSFTHSPGASQGLINVSKDWSIKMKIMLALIPGGASDAQGAPKKIYTLNNTPDNQNFSIDPYVLLDANTDTPEFFEAVINIKAGFYPPAALAQLITDQTVLPSSAGTTPGNVQTWGGYENPFYKLIKPEDYPDHIFARNIQGSSESNVTLPAMVLAGSSQGLVVTWDTNRYRFRIDYMHTPLVSAEEAQKNMIAEAIGNNVTGPRIQTRLSTILVENWDSDNYTTEDDFSNSFWASVLGFSWEDLHVPPSEYPSDQLLASRFGSRYRQTYGRTDLTWDTATFSERFVPIPAIESFKTSLIVTESIGLVASGPPVFQNTGYFLVEVSFLSEGGWNSENSSSGRVVAYATSSIQVSDFGFSQGTYELTFKQKACFRGVTCRFLDPVTREPASIQGPRSSIILAVVTQPRPERPLPVAAEPQKETKSP